MNYFELGTQFVTRMNEEFEDFFSTYLQEHTFDEENEVLFAKNYEKALFIRVDAWLENSFSELGNQDVSSFLNSLDAQAATSFIAGFAQESDLELPSIFKERLRDYTDTQRETYLDFIFSVDAADFLAYEDQEDAIDEETREADILRASHMLVLASVWQEESLVEKVLDWITPCEYPETLLTDAVTEYVSQIGLLAAKPVAIKLEDLLENPTWNQEGYEFLLVALTKIVSRDQESRDQYYPVFRNAFRKFTSKTVPVMCLGDLGSQRAIPLLTSYLENHIQEIDRTLYGDVIGALRQLGSSLEGLPEPFGPIAQQAPTMLGMQGGSSHGVC